MASPIRKHVGTRAHGVRFGIGDSVGAGEGSEARKVGLHGTAGGVKMCLLKGAAARNAGGLLRLNGDCDVGVENASFISFVSGGQFVGRVFASSAMS